MIRFRGKHATAIEKWVGIMIVAPLAFDLGRRLASVPVFEIEFRKGLLHVFAGRASGTIHQRAGPILRYVKWARGCSVRPSPLQEDDVYSFAVDREGDSAPTFLRSLMISISFCWHGLGLLGRNAAATPLLPSWAAKAPRTTARMNGLQGRCCRPLAGWQRLRLLHAA